MNSKLLVPFSLTFLATSALAECPADMDELVCEQREQVEAIMVDLNKSASSFVDDVVTTPQKVKESGCLEDIKSIDLSMFTVDASSIWTGLYKTVKDTIYNRVCSAAADFANEQTEKLNFKLEAPMGLGSIGINSGYGTGKASWSESIKTKTELSSEEAREKVIKETFGEYPSHFQRSYDDGSIDENIKSRTGKTPEERKNNTQERLDKVLDFDAYWSDGDPKDNGEGN